MKVHGREKDEHDDAQISHSLSTTVLVGISDTCSVEEMTSQQHYKLGAKDKWSDHADLPCTSGDESSLIPIPPWRDISLLRITTKKTDEGLLIEEPTR